MIFVCFYLLIGIVVSLIIVADVTVDLSLERGCSVMVKTWRYWLVALFAFAVICLIWPVFAGSEERG